jgi:hypothetical protein
MAVRCGQVALALQTLDDHHYVPTFFTRSSGWLKNMENVWSGLYLVASSRFV